VCVCVYIYIYIYVRTYVCISDFYIYHLFISLLIVSFHIRAGLPRNLVHSVFYQTFLRTYLPRESYVHDPTTLFLD